MKQQRYHYITLMKMKRETYILLILISLISLNPLYAINWNIGAFGGAYLFIPGPIQEDVIDPRISASASLIFSPLIFNITHDAQMALQLQLTHTTKSQYYGPIYWKEFTTIGTGLEITLGTLKPLSFSLAFIYALQFKDDERGWFDLGIIRTTFIIPFS
ncbi:MAG: hypothetical protein EOM67_11640, partial [Spirochaetia bacterium]|nr:hypothetical protein [Spirochaetia bacterium]